MNDANEALAAIEAAIRAPSTGGDVEIRLALHRPAAEFLFSALCFGAHGRFVCSGAPRAVQILPVNEYSRPVVHLEASLEAVRAALDGWIDGGRTAHRWLYASVMPNRRDRDAGPGLGPFRVEAPEMRSLVRDGKLCADAVFTACADGKRYEPSASESDVRKLNHPMWIGPRDVDESWTPIPLNEDALPTDDAWQAMRQRLCEAPRSCIAPVNVIAKFRVEGVRPAPSCSLGRVDLAGFNGDFEAELELDGGRVLQIRGGTSPWRIERHAIDKGLSIVGKGSSDVPILRSGGVYLVNAGADGSFTGPGGMGYAFLGTPIFGAVPNDRELVALEFAPGELGVTVALCRYHLLDAAAMTYGSYPRGLPPGTATGWSLNHCSKVRSVHVLCEKSKRIVLLLEYPDEKEGFRDATAIARNSGMGRDADVRVFSDAGLAGLPHALTIVVTMSHHDFRAAVRRVCGLAPDTFAFCGIVDKFNPDP